MSCFWHSSRMTLKGQTVFWKHPLATSRHMTILVGVPCIVQLLVANLAFCPCCYPNVQMSMLVTSMRCSPSMSLLRVAMLKLAASFSLLGRVLMCRMATVFGLATMPWHTLAMPAKHSTQSLGTSCAVAMEDEEE